MKNLKEQYTVMMNNFNELHNQMLKLEEQINQITQTKRIISNFSDFTNDERSLVIDDITFILSEMDDKDVYAFLKENEWYDRIMDSFNAFISCYSPDEAFYIGQNGKVLASANYFYASNIETEADSSDRLHDLISYREVANKIVATNTPIEDLPSEVQEVVQRYIEIIGAEYSIWVRTAMLPILVSVTFFFEKSLDFN